jgi:hypothetical protein
MKLALALAVLLLAPMCHADSILNITTSDIVFSNGNGGTDTLALSMQEDATTGEILSFSGEFTQGQLSGLVLSIAGADNSFVLTGGGIFMNFGLFDYSLEEYRDSVQGFPTPGVYSYGLFYNDNNMVGSNYIASWPESGVVTVTDPPSVPEPSSLLQSGIALAALIGLARVKGLSRHRR